MKTNLERIEKNEVALEIEVEEAEVAKAFQKAYRGLAKKVNIPGFRKGKAPQEVIKAYLGKEVVYEDVSKELIANTYPKAVGEANIEPIDSPTIDIIQLEENKPFIFKAKVTVKPEVELGQYKGIEVEKVETKVTADDVEAKLAELREANAKLETVEDGVVQKGDIVNIDFAGYVDDQPFEGGTAENFPLEIGSHSFIDNFEEQLLGAKSGDHVTVNVTFPDDYHAKDLAGKPARFEVKIHEIKRKVLQPLDDDFAKEVSNFETLAELKADLEKKMQIFAEQEAKLKTRDAVLKKVVANANVDIPEVLINNRLKEMIENFKEYVQKKGISYEDYLQHSKTDDTALREQFRPTATEAVKTELVLSKIAEVEGIDIDPKEVDQKIEEIAATQEKDAEEVKNILFKNGGINLVLEEILFAKTVDFLVENCKYVEASE